MSYQFGQPMYLRNIFNYPRQRSDITKGGHWADPEQDVGLELEWEDVNIWPAPRTSRGASSIGLTRNGDKALKYWGAVKDGSLRGLYPYEVLLLNPVGGKEIENALDELDTWIKLNRFVPDVNDRTSTHIHVNVNSWEYTLIQKFILIYALFEDYLFDELSPNRRSNPFCVPLYDMLSYFDQYKYITINQWENNRGNVSDNIIRSPRYAALNINSMEKHGSIEIRLCKGLSSAKEVTKLVELTLEMTKFVKDNNKLSLEEFYDVVKKEFKKKVTERCLLSASRFFLSSRRYGFSRRTKE